MRTIEVPIPDWANERHIYIFAGAELLGVQEVRIVHENGEHKAKYLPLKIKPENGRCNGCGSCCSDGGLPMKLIGEIRERLNGEVGKACPLLGDNGCIMKGFIPFSCLKSVCTEYNGCAEKVVEVG